MPLFGGSRDVAMFRQFNFEMAKHHTRNDVDIYKINLEATPPNIYGESEEKVYFNPVRVPCLVDLSNSESLTSEFGTDKTQVATYSFTRDVLVEAKLYIEIGDIIGYNGSYWEINNTTNDKLFYNRDPNLPQYDIDVLGNKYGWNVEFICTTHLLRTTKVNLNDTDLK